MPFQALFSYAVATLDYALLASIYFFPELDSDSLNEPRLGVGILAGICALLHSVLTGVMFMHVSRKRRKKGKKQRILKSL